MKFILGIKQNMTQVFDDAGNVEPVTVVSTLPNVITQVKTKEKDGYKSIQVGFTEQKERRLQRPKRAILRLRPALPPTLRPVSNSSGSSG